MFMAAARALADTAPARRDPAGALLPPLADSRRVARTIAIAVAEAARREGLADPSATGDARIAGRRQGLAAAIPDDEAKAATRSAVEQAIRPGPTRSDPMPLMPTSQYDTLTAMITPAIFLTANASLIISTSNRMSRVVDRIRVLNDLVDRMGRGVDRPRLYDRTARAPPRPASPARVAERPHPLRADDALHRLHDVRGHEPDPGRRRPAR